MTTHETRDLAQTVALRAGVLIQKVLPELWAIWCSDAEGARLHAEGRLAALDGGMGYEGATAIGSALAGLREARTEVPDLERLNALMVAPFVVEIPEGASALKVMVLELRLKGLDAATRGTMDLHHKRIHVVSKRLRALQEGSAVTRQELIGVVAEKAQVPGWAVNRAMAGGDKLITQHIERLEKACRELEALHG